MVSSGLSMSIDKSDLDGLIRSHDLLPQYMATKRNVFDLLFSKWQTRQLAIGNSQEVSENRTRSIKGNIGQSYENGLEFCPTKWSHLHIWFCMAGGDIEQLQHPSRHH